MYIYGVCITVWLTETVAWRNNFALLLLSGSQWVHYNDVIMGAIASQITSRMIVYSVVYSHANQRKHQSSASLAFVRGIHRWPVSSPHKWPVMRKMFPFDDVIMVQRSYYIFDAGLNINPILEEPRWNLLSAMASRERYGVSNHWQLDCFFNSLFTMGKLRVSLSGYYILFDNSNSHRRVERLVIALF